MKRKIEEGVILSRYWFIRRRYDIRQSIDFQCEFQYEQPQNFNRAGIFQYPMTLIFFTTLRGSDGPEGGVIELRSQEKKKSFGKMSSAWQAQQSPTVKASLEVSPL